MRPILTRYFSVRLRCPPVCWRWRGRCLLWSPFPRHIPNSSWKPSTSLWEEWMTRRGVVFPLSELQAGSEPLSPPTSRSRTFRG